MVWCHCLLTPFDPAFPLATDEVTKTMQAFCLLHLCPVVLCLSVNSQLQYLNMKHIGI